MLNNLVKLTLRHCIAFPARHRSVCDPPPCPCRHALPVCLPPPPVPWGVAVLPFAPPPPWPHVVHFSHPYQPLLRWPWGGLWGPALLAMSRGGLGALWPSGGPLRPGQGRAEALGSACSRLGWGPWILDPDSCHRRWGRGGPARAHAPASVELQMSHPAQAPPGGPGWVDGSGGRSATPATLPQTQGEQGHAHSGYRRSSEGRGVLSATEGSAAGGGQVRPPLVSHLPSHGAPPSTVPPWLWVQLWAVRGVSLLCLNHESDLLPAPSAGGFPRAPSRSPAAAFLGTAQPSSSSPSALSSAWASSPRGSLQLQLFRS